MTCRRRHSAKCASGEHFRSLAPTVSTSPWRTPGAWPWPPPLSPSTSPRIHLVSYKKTFILISNECSQACKCGLIINASSLNSSLVERGQIDVCLVVSVPLTAVLCTRSVQDVSRCRGGALLRRCAGGCLCIHCLPGLQVSSPNMQGYIHYILCGDAFPSYIMSFWPSPSSFFPPNISLSSIPLSLISLYAPSPPDVTRCTVPFVGHWWRTPAAMLGPGVTWSVWGRHSSPPARKATTCWLRDAPCRLYGAATQQHFCPLWQKYWREMRIDTCKSKLKWNH